MIGQLSPQQALISISATTTVNYYSSRLPSSATSGCSSSPNNLLSSLLSCPDGAPTVLGCEYSADVVIFYFLATTINVTAATVYYNVSPPYTLTNNLSSYYSSIAQALVPPPQTVGEGVGNAQTTVGLAFATPAIQYQEVFSESVDLNYSTLVTFFPPTAYMEATIDEIDITYYCYGTLAGSTFNSSLETELAPTAYFISAPLPISDSLWGNRSAMANLPEAITTEAPAFDAVFHSENPDLPWCTGSLNGYPSPLVVVNQLTTTIGSAASEGASSGASQPLNTGNAGPSASFGSSTSSDSSTTSGPSGSSGSPGSLEFSSSADSSCSSYPPSSSTDIGDYITSGIGGFWGSKTATSWAFTGLTASQTINGTATGYTGLMATGGANGIIVVDRTVVIMRWLCGLAIGTIVVM